jgi:uncharacterized protein (TIGR02598 family)
MKPIRAAFTIIECVLALGVASSLLLLTISLLPGGMDAVRVASHSSFESAIVQRVRHQCEGLLTLPVGELYFDEDGLPLSGRSAGAFFAVRLEPLPGALLPGDREPSMRRLRISITDLAQGEPFVDVGRVKSFHLLLAPPTLGGEP